MAVGALGLFGCVGEIVYPDQQGGSGGTVTGAGGGGGAIAPGVGGGGGTAGVIVSATGGNGGVIPPGTGGNGGVGAGGNYVVPPGAYLPARVRRLTNAEYDASVRALLGTTQAPSAVHSFPPDSRQLSYTLNDAQRVDPVLGKQLDAAAQALVTEARGNGKLAALSPCSPNTTAAQGEACARTFIQTFGRSAYRRALVDTETSALLTVWHAAVDGLTYNAAAYSGGIDLVTRAFLQSASFLYLTELGGTPSGSSVQLTSDELASSLSYVLTAGPPDSTLVTAAGAGMLATPEGREQEARRLLATAGGRDRVVRVVREWLGIDGIADIAKDTNVYPSFAGVRASMNTESVSFINEVVNRSTGTVSELLGADWSIVDSPLAQVYGVSSAGSTARTNLGSGRRGILNQGAFLAVFAHAHESAPVLRGVSIIRRVACLPLQSPTELNIVVVPPAPDPSKTTRERFAIHSTDSMCSSCHNAIDSIGFSFEEFDGMGRFRTTENGKPVNSATTLAVGSDFDGSYADSNALSMALASSPSVRTCVARQLFRGSAGRSDSTVTASESAFVEVWKGLPADQQGKLVEVLIAYVKSPLFIQRKVP